ncbi:hypothetical protein [Isoptericola sp. NPDC057191]|uniref:hypothetical protein n=1 Tax=Isoptericola sp. NPDC057191 TaxID=3346041 RepID=UPI003627BF70
MTTTTRPPAQRLATVTVATLALFGLMFAGTVTTAQPADAATTYTMVDKKLRNKRYIQYRQELGSCSVSKSGYRCRISHTDGATRTIGLSLGSTRSWVAGQLHIDKSRTVSSSVACTSGKMKKGQVLRAYPVGKLYSYRIRKLSVPVGWGGWFSYTTSKTKWAFDPQKNGIHCR